jgi:hypothetical protein
MKTKIQNLFIALTVLLLPAVVQAQDAYSTNADGSIYTYSTNAGGSANIVAYAGPPWVVTIPTNINGLTVTSIGTNAFYNYTSLTSVTIPGSVTSIGDSVFELCTSLTSVTIGDSVTSIGEGAFAGTSLTSVTIPNSVTTIGDGAFVGSGITSVTIPGSVTSIGDGTFYQCPRLTNVTIGNGVTSIERFAFYECPRLTSVTIPNSVTSIGGVAFAGCTSLTSVTIPNSVTSIGNEAFFGCASLTSVTIPNSVTSIGQIAFEECYSLTSVTIPNSVSSIGEGAFALCTSLGSVTIPASVTNIGGGAFNDCTSLTGVYFQGNSPTPTNDSSVFSGDPPYYPNDPVTVYYLPGTTGWGALFDGRPTAPWFLPNPLILNNGPGFGVQPGGFGFTISWATNASVVVEATTNLAHPVWLPMSTSPLTGGTSYFSDPQWTNYPERFYRVTSAFTVGGTLTGLPAGDTVTLQDNGSDNLTLSTNGTFTFPTALPNGQSYSVTVSGTSGRTPPNITLTSGSGTISGANVTNIAVQCSKCPEFTGNMDVDMYNAAVSDGTANGGVPAVMVTENGGPFRVTARGFCSDNVALKYSGQCVVAQIVGTTSCSSTTLPSGATVIQFGDALECGSGGPFGY